MSYNRLNSRYLLSTVILFGILHAQALAAVVFDNTTNPTGDSISAGPTMIQATLAPGARHVKYIAFPATTSGSEPLEFTVQAVVYANNGTDYGDGPAPGTQLWASDLMTHTLAPGVTTMLEFDVPFVEVPDTFTLWLLSYLTDGESPSLPRFFPADVGTVRYGVWREHSGTGTWSFNDTVAPYGAVVQAVDIPAVSSWGLVIAALALLVAGTALIRLRGRAAYAALMMTFFAALQEHTSAQVQVGPAVRVDSGGGAAANETSVAASRAWPFEVVVTWQDWRESPSISEEIRRIGAAVSDDGGATWAESLVPAGLENDTEGDPMTASDRRTGALWVGGLSSPLGLVPGALFVARWIPAEDDFQDPPVIPDTGYQVDKCFMAAGPAPNNPAATHVYIAYQVDTATEFLVPHAVVSTDLGDNWSAPVEIPAEQALEYPMGLAPRVGPDGELYVIWWDGYKGVFLSRSFDALQTWEDPVQVAERMDTWCPVDCGSRFPGQFRVPPLAYLAVDTSSDSPHLGALYCVYFDSTPPEDPLLGKNVDLYLTKSTDQGETWTTPIIINGDTPGDFGDQFFPWIEVDCVGNLHVVFFDTRHGAQRDYNPTHPHASINAYYAFSSDGSNTFQEFVLTDNPFSSEDDGLEWDGGTAEFWGDYLGLAAGFDKVYPAYPAVAQGRTDPDIYTNIIELEPGPCCTAAGSCQSVRPCACVDAGGMFLGYDSACETAADCNSNGADDQCDIATGESQDCNFNGIPDECESGCHAHSHCGTGQLCCCLSCVTGTCCNDGDCTNPNYPRCGEYNTCVECIDASDCAHLGPGCYCTTLTQECVCCAKPPCPMGPGGGG